MKKDDMHNVIYKKHLSNKGEEMGERSVSASLFLTSENNGTALFYVEGESWYLLCFFAPQFHDHSIEVAVRYAEMSVETLRQMVVTTVYPTPSC
jgi:hypothetical protein